jgi:phage tail protein X
VVVVRYTTKSGDTFDIIAKENLGKEKYAKELMQANKEYIEFVIFPAGIELELPEIDEESSSGKQAPPWRD